MKKRRFYCQHKFRDIDGISRKCVREGELCRVSVDGGMAWIKLLCPICQEQVREYGWKVEREPLTREEKRGA